MLTYDTLPPLPPAEISRMADILAFDVHEGYPPNNDRLRLGDIGLKVPGVIEVPDGPWEVRNHPRRAWHAPELLDAEVPAPGHEILQTNSEHKARMAGLARDQYGRPIIPYWIPLLGHKGIGLLTGLGSFNRYGGNVTLDIATYRQHSNSDPKFLLTRGSNPSGRWMLPTDFMDPRAASVDTEARRLFGDKTGLTDAGGSSEIVSSEIQLGAATTLHAWKENSLVIVHGNQGYLHDTSPVPRPGKGNAEELRWMSPNEIEEAGSFGARRQLPKLLSHLAALAHKA